jgi:hypothetical protein
LAANLKRHGAGEAINRHPVASKAISALLALAIKVPCARTAEDVFRHPRFDWGAPRIHGELLKLGIKISQATVGRYMPWRPKVPSPTWRSFLHKRHPIEMEL